MLAAACVARLSAGLRGDVFLIRGGCRGLQNTAALRRSGPDTDGMRSPTALNASGDADAGAGGSPISRPPRSITTQRNNKGDETAKGRVAADEVSASFSNGHVRWHPRTSPHRSRGCCALVRFALRFALSTILAAILAFLCGHTPSPSLPRASPPLRRPLSCRRRRIFSSQGPRGALHCPDWPLPRSSTTCPRPRPARLPSFQLR